MKIIVELPLEVNDKVFRETPDIKRFYGSLRLFAAGTHPTTAQILSFEKIAKGASLQCKISKWTNQFSKQICSCDQVKNSCIVIFNHQQGGIKKNAIPN